MYRVVVRKVQKFGDSYGVILPKSFCELNKLKKGESITLLDFGNFLILLPLKIENDKIEKIVNSDEFSKFKEMIRGVIE